MRPVHIQVGIGLCALLFISVYAEAQVTETLKVFAGPAASGDRLGASVAVSGNVVVVGAPGDNIFLNVAPFDVPSVGSVYVFDTTTGQLASPFKLTSLGPFAGGDRLGTSVAISGNTVVAGAPFVDINSIDEGAAYIFDLATTGQFRITASDAAGLEHFGSSVAVSGTTAIVGATGNGLVNAGSAYLFDTATGNQLFKLTPSDGAPADVFGTSVAVNGNLAVIGAPGNDDAGSTSGSAYIFDTVTGNQLFKLTASDAAAFGQFGTSVAVSGNLAIVGAIGLGSGGAAYVFDLTTGNELFKLTASDAAAGDLFGASVAIDGEFAVIGANRGDAAVTNSGAAYVFDLTTGNELLKLIASDAALFDNFGSSVSISNGTVIVGAINGGVFQPNSGAAYLFNNIVPEPATLSLLALGGLTLLRRRCLV